MFKFKWSIAVPAGVLLFCAAWGVAEWRRYTVQNQLDAPSKIGFSSSGIEDYADTIISQIVIPPEMRIANVIRVFQNMTYRNVSEQIDLLRFQEEMLLREEEAMEPSVVPWGSPVSPAEMYPPSQSWGYPEHYTEPIVPEQVPSVEEPDYGCSGSPPSRVGGNGATCPESRYRR